MTFNETYFEFSDEVERIEGDLEEARDELQELREDDDVDVGNSPRAQQLTQRISTLQLERKGVLWARDQAFESDDFAAWDEDVDGVTLGAIRAGAYGSVQDDIEGDPDAGGGTSTALIIAEGTVVNPDEGEEAPYVGSDMTPGQRAGAVGQLHPYYHRWAESRITELLDPESGNATSSGASPPETPPAEN